MLAALERLKAAGVRVIVFGDIFLEDLRAYREKLLAHVGLEGRYPLWGRDTDILFDEFIQLGFQAVTVCVDTKRLTGTQCGRLLNSAFRASLPVDCDPCGERGEYHSFAFDGPIFHQPVSYRLGEIHMHEPFAFQELLPAPVHQPELTNSTCLTLDINPKRKRGLNESDLAYASG
jgi:diphthamide synthase (EF-2-diphthine--ammonia ligase)